MTQDDVIRMAREAGFGIGQGIGQLRINGYADDLKRFAALVAAAEREACMNAAKQVADGHSRVLCRQDLIPHQIDRHSGAVNGAMEAYNAIRVRGQA